VHNHVVAVENPSENLVAGWRPLEAVLPLILSYYLISSFVILDYFVDINVRFVLFDIDLIHRIDLRSASEIGNLNVLTLADMFF
jgi:hypothetical protein